MALSLRTKGTLLAEVNGNYSVTNADKALFASLD